jgi:hypothetical protein
MNETAKKRIPLLWTTLIMLSFLLSACQSWGEADEPAGNQKNPVPPDASVKAIASFSFDTDMNATDADITGETFAYEGGTPPEIVEDSRRGNVLLLKDGYARFNNPMQNLYVAAGASVLVWVKTSETEVNRTLFSFADETGNSLSFTGNAGIRYKGAGGELEVNVPESVVTEVFLPDQWHLLGVSLTYDGYTLYIDGEIQFETGASSGDFDYTNWVDLITTAPHFYLGYDSSPSTNEIYFDDLKIYKNKISARDAQPVITLPDPVYLNTFDANNTATIVGDGSFVPADDPAFGVVFQNATGGTRQNYLLLPENVLSHSTETNEITIGVWVNSAYAGESASYMWSPLFTAYGDKPANNENTWPMLALQYRGVVQVNCSGWCDFTDVQNVKGANTLYHNLTDWLADRKWHYYAATFTEKTAKVFFDGQIVNEWAVDGETGGQVIKGLFSNGADLKYICLGGNQAWNWADPDPGFMFDDIAIYNTELTAEQIALIISNKK